MNYPAAFEPASLRKFLVCRAAAVFLIFTPIISTAHARGSDIGGADQAENSIHAWAQIKELSVYLEGIDRPVSLDELANHIGVNGQYLHAIGQQQKLKNPPNQNTNLYYYNNIAYAGSIISLSVYNNYAPEMGTRHQEQKISTGIDLKNNKSICITFKLIRPDAYLIGWEGREPGFHTGADGMSFLDYDYVYFMKLGSTAVMTFNKKNACLESFLITSRILEK